MKNNNITLLHYIAAIMVIVGHEFALLGIESPHILSFDINGLGLRILFMISGYLVAKSYLRLNNPIKYIGRRLCRIYPPLIICLIFTIIVMSFITIDKANYWQGAVDYFYKNITMYPMYSLPGVFTTNMVNTGINGSLWTLPIELSCFILLVPFLIIFLLLNGNKNMSNGYVIITILLLLIFDLYKVLNIDSDKMIFRGVDWFGGLNILVYFFVGTGVYLLDMEKFVSNKLATVFVLILICMPNKIQYCFTPVVIAFVLFSLVYEKEIPVNILKKDICYEMFLYSFPLQQTIIYLLGRYINNVYILLIISFIVIMPTAYLMNYVNDYLLSKIEKLRKVIISNENTGKK